MSPFKRARKPLGELLREGGVINIEQLAKLLDIQKKDRSYLGKIALRYGYLEKEELDFFLSLQEGYPYIEVKRCFIPKELLKILPPQFCKKYKVLPIEKIGNILSVVSCNPKDSQLQRAITEKTNLVVKFFLSSPKALGEVLETLI